MPAAAIKDMSFKVGQTLTIKGVPKPNATCFSVNIQPNDKDIALHINPRFMHQGDQKKIVCNSRQGGNWGAEHHEGGFPFKQGEKFKMMIKFNPDGFLVVLPDGNNITFPNRLGAVEYPVIIAQGDVNITGIKVE